MISVTAKIGVPFSKETSTEKKNSRVALLAEYKQAGKIVGDFILVDDNTIEIRFTDVPSAESFTEAILNLYGQYSDTVEIQEIKIV
jgi:hypothetical protein